MAGTWPTARAAIVAHQEGVTFTGGDGLEQTETLHPREFPPAAVQQSLLPYSYVVPPARTMERWPGSQRNTSFGAVRVRFIVGGRSDDLEHVARRCEALIEALAVAFDDAVALDGTADVVLSQEFTEFAIQLPESMWGFDMLLALDLSETVTLSH